jgi:ABC-type transport system involved in multi-copper enzyme maturation permease subunit
MIRALMAKDMRLFRNYLWSAVLATIGCYAISAVAAIGITAYQEPAYQGAVVRTYLAFSSGSSLGLPLTSFFACLLGGSAFTLERSDRSAEFLACLPPSRMNHLVSKLTIILAAVSIMLLAHLGATLAANSLLPYARAANYPVSTPFQMSGFMTGVAMNVLMVGSALSVSSWLKSNGVPILCGLLSPILIMSLVSLAFYALGFEGDAGRFQAMLGVASLSFGVFLAMCGGYWYVVRGEP